MNQNQQVKRKTIDDYDMNKEDTAKRMMHTLPSTSSYPQAQDYLPSPAEDYHMEEILVQPTHTATCTALTAVPVPLSQPAQSDLPMRPSTPPLGMTLSHYNPATGSYTSSQISSDNEIKSKICSGMTPVYRAPFERWGSCLI
ncbi:hypothetical protein MAM1_0588d10979 [Mucor ambiguus]|uniref:Uncharacterized protein n=1 Tax=Mucor ambiguus TaxID=91626 RepID=A0A0C9N5S6_9FUNG|nr:hypothetical protein MAM1_0588d10979 [Mucor ambiguus]